MRSLAIQIVGEVISYYGWKEETILQDVEHHSNGMKNFGALPTPTQGLYKISISVA